MTGIAVPKESRVKYLTRRTDEIQKIKASLSSSPDWELIKKVGHQMKGNAATFDFSELAFYGKRLEDAADAKNTAEIKQIMSNLEGQVAELLQKLG